MSVPVYFAAAGAAAMAALVVSQNTSKKTPVVTQDSCSAMKASTTVQNSQIDAPLLDDQELSSGFHSQFEGTKIPSESGAKRRAETPFHESRPDNTIGTSTVQQLLTGSSEKPSISPEVMMFHATPAMESKFMTQSLRG
jgi:hypothetical protein